MAFDVLINNYDRVPLIWNNEGNARNILLTALREEEGGEGGEGGEGEEGEEGKEGNGEGDGEEGGVEVATTLVPIDQAICCINPLNKISAKNFHKYEGKVRALLEALLGKDRNSHGDGGNEHGGHGDRDGGRERGEEAAARALEPARLFLQTCTGMDVGAAGVEAMSIGLRQGIVNIAQLTMDDVDRFTECLTGTLGVVKHDIHE